tara:strand:- start:733 stop:981 length:249 start_codon:yes stop_codon:yes gene_type:complete
VIISYISLKEVAAFLGLSQKYIYELVKQRKIPFYKPFGKKLMFKLDEVQAIIDSSKVGAIASPSEIDRAGNEMMLRRGKANG